jgi:hypothetical protein
MLKPGIFLKHTWTTALKKLRLHGKSRNKQLSLSIFFRFPSPFPLPRGEGIKLKTKWPGGKPQIGLIHFTIFP